MIAPRARRLYTEHESAKAIDGSFNLWTFPAVASLDRHGT
jgi:hypothetical protein